MKKFLLLISLLSTIVAHGQKTDATMKTSAVTIRDATVSGSNTATRVGTMFVDLVDNKKNVVDVITATGTNTYSITTPYVMTSITSGWSQKIKFTNGNTGASTLTINTTIGPINLRKYIAGSPAAILSGDIPAGRIFELTYDGTNLQIDIASATVAASPITAGIAKLYTTTGSNTDGSMDQNSITTALATKFAVSSNLSEGTPSTMRTNLGLGTLATQNGTSPSGTIVGTTDTQTLTNKTLTSPIINFGSDANGDIIIRSSGAYTRLPIGSSTQVLTISGGLPSWQAPITGSSTFVGLTDGPGSFTGKSLNYSRVNVGETALEYRTPSQVRSDIGAGTGDGTVTNVASADGSITVTSPTTTVDLAVVKSPILTTSRTIGTVTGDATSAGSSFNGSANNTNAITVTKINGTSLAALTTGILKNTTSTGVPSIAVAGDFPTLNQNTTGSSGSVANALTVDNSSIQLNSGTTYDGSAARTISVKNLGITNAMLAGSIDLTAKVTGLLPDGNISSATNWNLKQNSFVPTAVKTSNYTAAVNDFVPCDNTGGTFTVTLPTAPADKSVVGVKIVVLGGSNTITIAAGGSDVFNKAGGSTTLSLTLPFQAVMLQYKSSSGIWYVISTDAPITAFIQSGSAAGGSLGGTYPNPTVVTNANLTGDVTSVGNATTYAGTVPLNVGGTNANLTASNGGIFYSTGSAGAILAGTATANKILVSGASGAPSWSTPTFPNASATSGKTIRSDGTNWIASTATLSDAPSTALKWLRSDGTNWITSTSTLAEGGVTSGKILKSDGTNWTASTETYAAPGTSGNILTSDGTNWTSAAPAAPTGTYLLASGGTASASNTFTSNTANWFNWGGTITATANSQFYQQINPSLTARATASDFLITTLVNPTLIATANSQSSIGVDINPTFTNGAFSSLKNLGLRMVTGSMLLGASSSNVARNTYRLEVIGFGTTSGTGALAVYNSSNNRIIGTADDGQLIIGSASGSQAPRIAAQSNGTQIISGAGLEYTTTFPNSSANRMGHHFSSVGNITESATTTTYFASAEATLNVSSGANNLVMWRLQPTINQTSTASGSFTGYMYDPIVTAALGANYSFISSSGNAGFGTLTPTVTVDVVGGLANRQTTNAQITANQNNYAIGSGSSFRLSTDASRNVTGLTGGVDGKILLIRNTGSFDIVFTHEDTNSTAANRLTATTGANITISANHSIMLQYDATSSRWFDLAVR